jgi:phenylacetate-CoA ligase
VTPLAPEARPPAPGAQPLAPPARIRRGTAWQRAYAARAARTIDDLRRFAALDPDHARRALDGRLGPLRAALLASPHWRRVLREAALAPSDLRTLDDLAAFPSLDRDTLRACWADLPGRIDADAVVVASSGTTGDPVPVIKDGWDTLHMWSVLRFFVAHLGIALPRRPRVVLLCALPGGLEYSARLPLVDDGALHRISTVRPRPLERLRRAAPSVVCSDPAGLHWLAAQADPPRPALILTSAQRFAPAQRASFTVPVVNYYATTETGPIAWECLARPERFHVLVPDVFVDSVAGELVVTRLRPGALPLLRYRTGDRGAVSAGVCACGWRGWTITGFTGRRACDYVTPDGRRVDAWSLAWLFKHVPLRSFRLTQVAPSAFELLVDGEAPLEPLAARVEHALRVLGWRAPAVAPRRVDSLAAAGDKPEPFAVAQWSVMSMRNTTPRSPSDSP